MNVLAHFKLKVSDVNSSKLKDKKQKHDRNYLSTQTSLAMTYQKLMKGWDLLEQIWN